MDLLQQSFLPGRTYQAVPPNDILRSIDGRHVQRQRHLGEQRLENLEGMPMAYSDLGGYYQRKFSWEISGFQSSNIATKTKNIQKKNKSRTVSKRPEEKHEKRRKEGEIYGNIMSKGKVGYPWESTRDTYQHIPPIYGLYNGCIWLYRAIWGSILGTTARVLSQRYPHFPVDHGKIKKEKIRKQVKNKYRKIVKKRKAQNSKDQKSKETKVRKQIILKQRKKDQKREMT